MPAPSSTDGSISFRRDRSKFQVRAWQTADDGSRVRVSLGMFDTEAEAQAQLDAFRVLNQPTGPMTRLKDLIEPFTKARKAANFRCAAHLEKILKRFIDGHVLGEIPISQLMRPDCQRWLNSLAVEKGKSTGKPLCHQTIKNARNGLSSLLQFAVRQGLLMENLAVGLVLPDGHATDERTALSADEIVKILSDARITRADRLLYQVAIYTGLRQGELWHLHWDDVQLDGPLPYVWVRYGSREGDRLLSPKGNKERRVALLTEAEEALRELKKTRKTRQVFPSCSDGYRQPGAPKFASHVEMIEAKGVVPGRTLVFHSLRHTCGTMLVQGWFGQPWSLEEVRGLLGHASVKTTERYARLGLGEADGAARRTRAADEAARKARQAAA